MTAASATPTATAEILPVHICVRQTLPWEDAALVSAGLHPRFQQKYDTWNATLTMPYRVFRQRLTEIARLNVSRVDGAVSSSIGDVPAGHLIVPVDDDDWFAPDLVAHLRRANDSQAVAYLWSQATLQPEGPLAPFRRHIARLVGRRDKHVCKTCNYALRQLPSLTPLLSNHVHASRYVDAHPAQVRRLPATLSIQNRSLASQTTLAWGRPTIHSSRLISLVAKYRGLYTDWRPPDGLQWAVPYVRLMAELMTEIRVRPDHP